MRPCVYVTSGWGVHDERWVAALRELNFRPRIIRLGVDTHDAADLRASVEAEAVDGAPVLAGPLDTITIHLAGISSRLVGLSWGFDMHRMSDRSWLASLDGLIVDSEVTRRLAEGAGVASKAITFLPWGVDLNIFSPDGPRADLTELDIPAEATTVLSLRAHEEIYRVADILDSFAAIAVDFPNAHLIIGNQGSLTDELRERAERSQVAKRMHFITSMPEADLAQLLRSVDIYVSASEVDGTSVTLLQAMACATPVLVSDSPGNQPWVLPGETGFVFATGNKSALQATLRQALTSTLDHREAMTRRSRELVEQQADWKANVPRLAQALDDACRKDLAKRAP